MEGVCNIKIIPIREGSMELRMCENLILFLPVNTNTHSIAPLAFLAARHTTMCLDYRMGQEWKAGTTCLIKAITQHNVSQERIP